MLVTGEHTRATVFFVRACTNLYDEESCCCLTRIIKSVVIGQAPVTLELGNTPWEEHKQTKSDTRVYHSCDAVHASARNIYKESKIGSQPTMCQVCTGAYVSLLAPRKTGYTACHLRKTTTHILDAVPITTRTQVRRKSIGKKKRRKGKETKEKKAENERNEKKRQ